jgi:RNA polymerase sigma factor (sigma-70 family)
LPATEVPTVEPGLTDALAGMSKNQRVTVVLIHGMQHSEREVAELLGISRWSVRTHAERGMKRIRHALGVNADVTT